MLTAEIVSAYVSRNALVPSALCALIESVHSTLNGLSPETVAAPEPEARRPAVAIGESITRRYIVCLEDGKKLKTLRRHLATHGLTPEQYRAKWHLPETYAMEAPEYRERRSTLARASNFGVKKPRSGHSHGHDDGTNAGGGHGHAHFHPAAAP